MNFLLRLDNGPVSYYHIVPIRTKYVTQGEDYDCQRAK